MTEAEWLTSADPAAMLDFVCGHRDHRDRGRFGFPVSERKLRLFACACCRQVWHLLTDERRRMAVEVTERYADGLATEEDTAAWVAWCNACDAGATLVAVADQAALLRHIVGNPWKLFCKWDYEELRVNPDEESWDWLGPTVEVQVCRWMNVQILHLAEQVYAGEPVAYALHDALLEAGQPTLAEHFSIAEHPKGCHFLDVLTGRE